MSQIFLSAPDISGREQELVSDVFESNYIAPAGEMLSRFESDMCSYTGFSNALAVSSGTAALHLAILNEDIEPGREIWTQSMTFIGGVSPIRYVGAVPVFFDLDPSSWTIDCELIEEELIQANKANRLPAAIISTDLYGQAADLERLGAICAEYDIPLISDSAEGVGAFCKKRHAGKGAKSAILSFNGNKIITSSGGGMLVSDDKKLIDRARYLSTQARQPEIHYEHTEIGFNYRLSNVSAAIGVGQLEMIEAKVSRRRAIFEQYVDSLSHYDFVKFMPEPADRRSSRWLTCMTIDRNDAPQICNAIIEAMTKNQIETRPLWKPMHMQPVFAERRYAGRGNCEDLFSRGLCLPSGSGMSNDEQTRVIDGLESVLRKFSN